MFESFVKLLGAVGEGPAPDITPKTNVDGLIVSTVISLDQGPETAILALNKACCVERYDREQDAIAGHEKWADELRTGRVTFTDVGYDDVVEPTEYTLEPYPADHPMMKRFP